MIIFGFAMSNDKKPPIDVERQSQNERKRKGLLALLLIIQTIRAVKPFILNSHNPKKRI